MQFYPSKAVLLHQVANQKSSPTALYRSAQDFACITYICNCTSNQYSIHRRHNFSNMGKLQLQIEPGNSFLENVTISYCLTVTLLVHISITNSPKANFQNSSSITTEPIQSTPTTSQTEKTSLKRPNHLCKNYSLLPPESSFSQNATDSNILHDSCQK